MNNSIRNVAQWKLLKNVFPYLALIFVIVFSSLSGSIHRKSSGRDGDGRSAPTDPDPATSARLIETYGQLPLSFEANRGQAGGSVNFLARSRGCTMFLTPTEAVFQLRNAECGMRNEIVDRHESRVTSHESRGSTVRMKLVASNPDPQVNGHNGLPGRSNYLLGDDPSQWLTDVPSYSRVQYEEVYPGIDLVYYGNQRQLEYDFVVAPGSNPKTIALNFEGADKLELDSKGDLVLHVAGGQVRHHKPIIYQEVAGKRVEVAGAFKLLNPQSAIRNPQSVVGFEVGDYDVTHPLVIDPTLQYSTYLGGLNDDQITEMAVDAAGNTYLTGQTSSPEIRLLNPLQSGYGGGSSDVFVIKLNPAGMPVYSTYIGGSSGDSGRGIAVDVSGNIYITGSTQSLDFPTVAPIQRSLFNGLDIFVCKLNAAGNQLIYSTYWGGSNDENGWGIAADTAGNAYVTGNTRSIDFPTVNPIQRTFGGGGAAADRGDAFAFKLNNTGSAVDYSTYLGGNHEDRGNDIAVDLNGNAYVIGDTYSTNFPITNNAVQPTNRGNQDAFISKINGIGTVLLYSTYLGGGAFERGMGIAVDATGAAFVTGFTDSSDFGTTFRPFQETRRGPQDGFVVKLGPGGNTRVYSTYLGGSQGDQCLDIAIDTVGDAYVTGKTTSNDFPRARALQRTLEGDRDAFVTKLINDGQELMYSTYFGGSLFEEGIGIGVDSAGNAYITGVTSSNDLPRANAFQSVFGGGQSDAFVAKISDP